ncbi:Sugar phosphate isomerase/epimerase [Singulisphaera sp. GP187]|uniref:sugar phosphate isomerase/epimerase family protein n=1 Tax=Singulisphaera sp. GP187 TaxID=1882752 RepID=UPI0009290E8F|nr:sugar phosphate isomerase/epimerase family protein [Singulisphaera sp. GP187]SIO65590.1 Sugar phosphate isomerase/epimerase [Singulisphaera sp. GP187]
MTVRIGLDHYTIGHRNLSAEETLEFAQTHSFDGVQFLNPESIDRSLAPDRLTAFRRQADERNLYLEVGLPSPNPVRRSRQEDREITAAEHSRDLVRHIEAIAALGCRHARAYVGDRHDRFRTDVRWEVQRAATLEVLSILTPRLRELGLQIALETHADLTVDELVEMIDHLGPDVAGVTFDTGNLLMRLDEPIAAAERLAPHVLATHVKDAILGFTPRGLCWQARPIGSGVIPMPDILAILIHANPQLTLSIELHPRTYDLPIFDKTWLSFFPALRADALAGIVGLAERCHRRFAEGSLIRPEVVEAIPWADRDLDWIASSLGYLRTVVPYLARFEDRSPPECV